MQKDYETFVEKLEIGIYEATGIPRENISFEKEGGRFAPVGDRLLVKFAEHDDAWEVCGLYTQELFKSYQNGSPFEEIIKEITDDLNRIKKADIYEKTRVIRDYEKTKPRLFIRLLNADKYSADLQDAVYKTLGDIALVLYMKVTEYEGCVTSTKIRQGMLEQWGKECDEVFQEALSHLDRQAAEHRIAVKLPDDLLMARIDVRLIVQVIINIVNNAVKYTPAGSHILLRAEKQGTMVAVSIADDGPGIPEEAKAHLFDMFYTASQGKSDNRRGLGLGLSLCRSIVSAHGGDITVSDNHPHGAVFTFTLPLEEVDIHV